MCGEAAADPRMIPLLLSFGLDEFSVNPSSVLSVRKKLSELDLESCNKIAQKALSMENEKEISSFLSSL